MGDTLRADIQRYMKEPGRAPGVFRSVMLVTTNRGLFSIAVYRFGYWINAKYGTHEKRYNRYFLKFFFHLARKLVNLIAKVEILEGARIGGGLFLSNKGEIILGVRTMGENCSIATKVTIGMDARKQQLPSIGDYVSIEANSVIYGEIEIGTGAIIAECTVVNKNIPDRCLVRGNPAKIVERILDDRQFSL